MDLPAGQLEWLETSRFGSFSFGCVDRKLRRKYHCLLTVREPGRGNPWNVLAEVREHLTNATERAVLSDPLRGSGERSTLVGFTAYPCATHHYQALGLDIERAVRFDDADHVEIRYRVRGVHTPVTLELEPLLRCRDFHALTFENPFLDGSFTRIGDELRMLPYAGMPEVSFCVEGAQATLATQGAWLTDVHYELEEQLGYAAHEHLFSPGRFVVELERDTELTLVVGLGPLSPRRALTTIARGTQLSFAQKLQRALRQFVMESRSGATTIVAGYPWFGTWGRDTLIALPGLHLATNDFEQTAAVLDGLLKARVNGLVPNIVPLGDTPANTSSIDASLLFVRAVQWLEAHAGSERIARFMPGVCELLEAIADARDSRMHFDLGVGVWMERGPWALTWMDAKVDEQPVTPRAGYAIEVDALAYNAARFACDWADAHRPTFARAFRARLRTAEVSFLRRYWDDARGFLADGHDGQRPDTSLRPNQLFALGLPFSPVPAPMAKSALAAITRELLVPAGLRTLSPRDANYRGTYRGDQRTRDCAYHQGTVWPWLIGIYADAVLAVHGPHVLADRLAPVFSFMAKHLDEAGCVGQLAEVFSGNDPHDWGGAPSQAWSVAEVYRAARMLNVERSA